VEWEKCFLWWRAFFAGVLAFLGGLVMVNRGEAVVNWVVNRGAWKTLFGRQIFSSF
jgi:hypothetical protein